MWAQAFHRASGKTLQTSHTGPGHPNAQARGDQPKVHSVQSSPWAWSLPAGGTGSQVKTEGGQ